MSLFLEWNKIKRTGFLAAFAGGGIIAALVPILDMAVRSDVYIGLDGSPVDILFLANWQMMAMLNILLIVTGACILYHMEYSENAIQRICTLPIQESSIFFGKFAVIAVMYLFLLGLETGAIIICCMHWFTPPEHFLFEILKNLGYSFLLMIPGILVSLMIASACKNMWISLGIGVICVFTATMLPTDNFTLSLFPFALPFQTLADTTGNTIRNFSIAAGIESIIIAFAEIIFLKIRRSFQ